MPYEQIQFLQEPIPSDVSQLYAEWQLTQRAKKLVGKFGGQCVIFARNFTQATPELVGGMAKNVKTNTTTPEVGAIGITNQSKWGHLFVVIALEGQNMSVVDSNFNLDGIVHIRQVNSLDPDILGYKVLN